jgi:hypothetical protein
MIGVKGGRKRNLGKGQSNPLLQIAANHKLRTINGSTCVAGNKMPTNEENNPIGSCVRLLVKTIPRVLIEDFEQSAAVRRTCRRDSEVPALLGG